MFIKCRYVLIALCLLIFPIENSAFIAPSKLLQKDELSLTVLTYFCDHLLGRPMSLKVYVEGGSPAYTLEAGALVIGQLSEHEFVILGLNLGEGVDVTVTDALGATADFWAEAFVMPTPGAEAGMDKVISCADNLAILDGSSDIDDVAYSWSGPDQEFDNNEQKPGVGVPGEYHLTVISMVNGCRSYDSTMVYAPEYPEFDFSYSPLECFGVPSGVISFESVAYGIPPYNYSIDGALSFDDDPFFDGLHAGWFELVVQDQNSCRDDTLIQLTEPDSIFLEIVSPIIMPYGQAQEVQVETNLSFDEIEFILWEPGNGLSCIDCLEPIANPKNSTVYQLLLEDNNGCLTEATLEITVEKDTDVYIPNSFSPNGDNVNDVFFIEAANGVVNIEMLKIYNRWGNIVFEALNTPLNDPFFGWDGKYKGVTLSPDVFVFFAVLKLVDGEELILYGDLTLLR